MILQNPARPATSRSDNTILRVLAALWAFLSLGIGLLNVLKLSAMGFPDGYRSPYERDIEGLAGYLALACFIQASYFFVTGFRPGSMTLSRLGIGILIAVCVIMVPIYLVWNCPYSNACTFFYESMLDKAMDHGQGG